MLGKDLDTDDPTQEWKSLEIEILNSDSSWTKEFEKDFASNRFRDCINLEIVIRHERIIRALCRLFTLGDLPQLASQCYGDLSHFIKLHEEQLGRTIYSPVGDPFQTKKP